MGDSPNAHPEGLAKYNAVYLYTEMLYSRKIMNEPKLHVSIEIHLKINIEQRNKVVKNVSNGYY